MAREGGVTVGTVDLVQSSVLNFNVAAQVVLTQALLRAEATVVDGLNLEQEDQRQENVFFILGNEKFSSQSQSKSKDQNGKKRYLERVMGREMKLQTMIVFQLGDRLVAVWEGALVEGGRYHVLVVKVTKPQGLLAVQKDPKKHNCIFVKYDKRYAKEKRSHPQTGQIFSVGFEVGRQILPCISSWC